MVDIGVQGGLSSADMCLILREVTSGGARLDILRSDCAVQTSVFPAFRCLPGLPFTGQRTAEALPGQRKIHAKCSLDSVR